MALHLVEMIEQDFGKGIAVGKTEKARKAFQVGTLGRQNLRLLVIDHLQAVLDRAQEAVSLLHVVAHGLVDPVVARQPVEGGERVAVAQVRVAPARDQLLGLRKKLDLANAAAADLDIVAFDRDLAVPAIDVDLPLHRLHVGDGGEIQIFAPHEWRQVVEQRFAGRDVAGAGARLDQRGALPVLPGAFVIGQRRRGRDRDRGRGRIGPQPQVGAEHIAVAVALLQELHQLLRQPHEQRRSHCARRYRRRPRRRKTR